MSDQQFLDRFDIVMGVDDAQPDTFDTSMFVMPQSSVLGGVTSFTVVGAAPSSVVDVIPDVTPAVLARASPKSDF